MSQVICHSGRDKPAPYLIRGNPVPFWIPAPSFKHAGTSFSGIPYAPPVHLLYPPPRRGGGSRISSSISRAASTLPPPRGRARVGGFLGNARGTPCPFSSTDTSWHLGDTFFHRKAAHLSLRKREIG